MLPSFQIFHNRHLKKKKIQSTRDLQKKSEDIKYHQDWSRSLDSLLGEKNIKDILYLYKRIMLILVRNDTTTRVNETQWESKKEEIQSDPRRSLSFQNVCQQQSQVQWMRWGMKLDGWEKMAEIQLTSSAKICEFLGDMEPINYHTVF